MLRPLLAAIRPQACTREWQRLVCTGVNSLDDGTQVKACSADLIKPICTAVQPLDATTTDDVPSSRERLAAASRGVVGWGSALRLNDMLKTNFAESSSASQLYASPLLDPDEQNLASSVHADTIKSMGDNRLPGVPQSLKAAFEGLEGSGLIEHSDANSAVGPLLSKTTAAASIIAFTGGGATMTYSMAVQRSAGLELTITTAQGCVGPASPRLEPELEPR